MSTNWLTREVRASALALMNSGQARSDEPGHPACLHWGHPIDPEMKAPPAVTLFVAAVAVGVGLYFTSKPPSNLLPNGDFQLCNVPEQTPIQTNFVLGWGEVKNGTVKLLSISNDTKVVWTMSATGVLQRTFKIDPRRDYVVEGDVVKFRKGKVVSRGRETNIVHHAENPESSRASSGEVTLLISPDLQEFRTNNYDFVLGDNFVFRRGKHWDEK